MKSAAEFLDASKNSYYMMYIPHIIPSKKWSGLVTCEYEDITAIIMLCYMTRSYNNQGPN